MSIPVMLVSMSPFIMVVAVVWIAFNASTQRRKATLTVIEAAIRDGQSMTPDTIRALGMPRKDGNGDLKGGAILLAIALSLLLLGWAVSAEADEDVFNIMSAIASFPGLIGLVLIGFGLMNRPKDEVAAQ
ncbi:DUF6249 domain-containing protein [Maricaulis sp.]|uniref:DUF6249 domain-containing protein n=1 Tax=Maricaulis sp. TaxID=1486257 RepID=UPI00260F7665|nr:DUF6249 domain-containing protein [Maricaulis sp.]